MEPGSLLSPALDVTAEVISSMQALSLGPAMDPLVWQALQSTDAWYHP